MPYDNFQVVCLHLAVSACVLKFFDYTIKCGFKFGIEVISDKALCEIFVIDRRKKFLERLDVQFDVPDQAE